MPRYIEEQKDRQTLFHRTLLATAGGPTKIQPVRIMLILDQAYYKLITHS